MFTRILLYVFIIQFSFNMYGMKTFATQSDIGAPASKKRRLNNQSEKKHRTILRKYYVDSGFMPRLECSPDGKFFMENIPSEYGESQITMWNSLDKKPFHVFASTNARLWKFCPHSQYVLLSEIGSQYDNTVPPTILFSIADQKRLPLQKGLQSIEQHYNIAVSSNGRYIMNGLRDKETNNRENVLFRYCSETSTVKNILLPRALEKTDTWTFCDESAEKTSNQSILFIPKPSVTFVPKQSITLTKYGIDDESIAEWAIPASVDKIKTSKSIVALKCHDLRLDSYSHYMKPRDETESKNYGDVRLLKMQDQDIIHIQTIPCCDSFDDIRVLSIPSQNMIILQSNITSFDIFNDQRPYNKLHSYTLIPDEKIKTPIITKLITNQSGNILMVSCQNKLPKYHTVGKIEPYSSSSRILIFDLLSITTSPICIDFEETITSMKFLNNTVLLLQGIKTMLLDIKEFFDTKKLKLHSLGKSQYLAAHENFIVQMNQSPTQIYNRNSNTPTKIFSQLQLLHTSIDTKTFESEEK